MPASATRASVSFASRTCARLAASVSMALALSAGATIAHAQDAGDTDTTDDTDAADTTDAADAMRDATRDGDVRREGKAQDARREGRARTGTPDVLAVAGRVHVRDTGKGIAPEDIPRALERFSQVDGRLSRKYDGAGLGLPMAKQFMELHGGMLDLASTPGLGTQVRIAFPARRLAAATVSA